ncbi:acyltransferase [Streptomyces sp. UNOC14_S4]|uniref:acyltransferase family protein n=1 Tax=Streptomyces sp. UNOC14_S4 TaxID=2872340 RepID=UPI001E3C13B1|nr:acyltransferase [Streptomyces sp. UNOC14_S4]MCC3769589.1 acyltransferase [Streptomyces sp. UNOC14_S4]
MPERLPSLTGMRGVAASVVFLTHVVYFAGQDDRSGRLSLPVFAVSLGTTAVSLFFLLSGFVLTCTASPADTARSFLRKRLFRICPSHLVVWAGFVLLVRCAGVPRGDGYDASVPGDLAGALLVNTLIPVERIAAGGNPVTWSLTCEVVFYLLFPFLLARIDAIRPARLPLAAGAAVAAVWAVPLASLALDGPEPAHQFIPGFDLTLPQVGLAYLFPAGRLPEFVLGMILARIHLRPGARIARIARRVGSLPAALLVLGALAAGRRLLPSPFALAAVTVLPLALLLLALAAADVAGRRSLLRTLVMRRLGELSYAVYLTHFIVILTVNHYLGSALGITGRTGIALVATLLVSWLLHTRVERPCMRRFATPSARRPTVGEPGLAGSGEHAGTRGGN